MVSGSETESGREIDYLKLECGEQVMLPNQEEERPEGYACPNCSHRL